MKKFILLFITPIIFSSCGSVFSTVSNKEVNINTKCDNCYSNNKFYRGYGKSEAPAGPGSEMGVRDEATLIAQAYISKEINTHVMNVASRVFEKKIDGKNQKIKSAFVEATKTQSHALLTNSNVICRESKVGNKRKGQSYVISTTCIEISKKDLNDELYRANKELFSQAEIDYETFNIRLSAQLKDK
tara:strand:- start:232 stop:792 length:561 start_codon:yes stop_codon:yes gene_type:complete